MSRGDLVDGDGDGDGDDGTVDSGPGSPCRIVTLTMNPAVDESACVDHLVSDRKLRCSSPRYEPGGGGINVSRALRRLGDDSLAIYPAGGASGELLHKLLDREGLRQETLPIAGQTRVNFNVLEKASGRQYRFVFPGPTLAPVEWDSCLRAMTALRPAPEYIVASGSLPPGVPEDFYAQVALHAREVGARLLLDVSGPPLKRALEVGVYLAKPSLHEFAELLGASLDDESRVRDRGREFVRRGGCQTLVVSLGAAGALWLTATEEERVAAPAVAVSSSVGAGDSLLAGILFFLARGRPISQGVRFGVAVASATVLKPGTELLHPVDAWRFYEQMREVYA